MRGRVKVDVDWGAFSGGSVILPICPRSPGVRRRNLAASLGSLRARAGRLKVVLCDTLDRHNLDVLNATERARQGGDLWLATSIPEIMAVFPNFDAAKDIFRWDDVRADPSFARRLTVLNAMYDSSESVRLVIERIADKYLEKRDAYLKKYGLPFNRARELRRSSAYLIEEFAGTAVYADWFPNTPEAYWGVYVGDHRIFDQLNTIDRSVRLTLPETLALHIASLDPPVAGDRPLSAAA